MFRKKNQHSCILVSFQNKECIANYHVNMHLRNKLEVKMLPFKCFISPLYYGSDAIISINKTILFYLTST